MSRGLGVVQRTIMGLFRGLPIGMDSAPKPATKRSSRPLDTLHTKPRSNAILPRAIVLYRKNLVRAVRTREDLNRQIRRTLAHEIGHLQGMDESELRRRGLD